MTCGSHCLNGLKHPRTTFRTLLLASELEQSTTLMNYESVLNSFNFLCLPLLETIVTGWPLTWKTWKSQGIPKWSGKSQGKLKKSGSEVRCVFSSSKYSKTPFSAGALPRTPLGSLRRSPDSLVGCGEGHPIPFPQLLQPQLLNNWLSGFTLFFINMKQRMLTIWVNTRYRVIFPYLYWKVREKSGNFMWSGKWSLCNISIC